MSNPTNLPLPSTRDLLTSLISTIATSTHHDQEETSNPLSTATPNTQSALLTLHTLFPNDLLPALDLLDRGLVTRFVSASAPPDTNTTASPHQPERPQTNPTEVDESERKQKVTVAYHVRTAQKPPSRSRAALASTSYQVHLAAWSCSCAAFAFAAFPAGLAGEGSGEVLQAVQGDDGGGTVDESWVRGTETGWRFGGLTRGDGGFVCKHLLACVIAERCGGFARLVEEREVGMEEVAGWAAGWGD